MDTLTVVTAVLTVLGALAGTGALINSIFGNPTGRTILISCVGWSIACLASPFAAFGIWG